MKKFLSKLFYVSCFILILVSCITALDKYTIRSVLNGKTAINLSNENKVEIKKVFKEVEQLDVDVTVYESSIEHGRDIYHVYTTDSSTKTLEGWFTCTSVKSLDIDKNQLGDIKTFYVDKEHTEQVLHRLKALHIDASSDFTTYGFVSLIDIYKIFSVPFGMLIIAQFLTIVIFENRKQKNNILALIALFCLLILIECIGICIINKRLNLFTFGWISVFNSIYLLILCITNRLFYKIPPFYKLSKDWKKISFHLISLLILFLMIASAFFGSTTLSLTKQAVFTYDNTKDIQKLSNYITFQVSGNKENIDMNNITYYIDSMYDLYNTFHKAFHPIIIDTSDYSRKTNANDAYMNESPSAVYVNEDYINGLKELPKSILNQFSDEKTNVMIYRKNANATKNSSLTANNNIIYYDKKINLKIFDSNSKVEEYPPIVIYSNTTIRDYMFNYFSNGQIFIEIQKKGDLDAVKDSIKNSKLANILSIIEVDSGVKQVSFHILRESLLVTFEVLTIILALLILMDIQKSVCERNQIKKLNLIAYRCLYIVSAIVCIVFVGRWFAIILIYLLLSDVSLLHDSHVRHLVKKGNSDEKREQS